MEDRAYGCVLTVLIGIDYIVGIMVVYQLACRGYCGMMYLGVAVRWVALQFVGGLVSMGGLCMGGLSMGGVLYHWKSVAFPHAALIQPCLLQNLLFHFSAVVDLCRRV